MIVMMPRSFHCWPHFFLHLLVSCEKNWKDWEAKLQTNVEQHQDRETVWSVSGMKKHKNVRIAGNTMSDGRDRSSFLGPKEKMQHRGFSVVLWKDPKQLLWVYSPAHSRRGGFCSSPTKMKTHLGGWPVTTQASEPGTNRLKQTGMKASIICSLLGFSWAGWYLTVCIFFI